jgi:hypothetical protein
MAGFSAQVAKWAAETLYGFGVGTHTRSTGSLVKKKLNRSRLDVNFVVWYVDSEKYKSAPLSLRREPICLKSLYY